MIYVISRGEGPKNIISPNDKFLTPYKKYEIISISYQNPIGNWIEEKLLKYNPKESKFYIKIIDDMGNNHDIWNDYFLSTEEMREFLLNKLEL